MAIPTWFLFNIDSTCCINKHTLYPRLTDTDEWKYPWCCLRSSQDAKSVLSAGPCHLCRARGLPGRMNAAQSIVLTLVIKQCSRVCYLPFKQIPSQAVIRNYFILFLNKTGDPHAALEKVSNFSINYLPFLFSENTIRMVLCSTVVLEPFSKFR